MKRALQTYILKRYLHDDQIENMIGEYNSNRKGTGSEKRQVAPLDYQIYEDHKKGMYWQELVRKYGRSYSYLYRSVSLVVKELQDKQHDRTQDE